MDAIDVFFNFSRAALSLVSLSLAESVDGSKFLVAPFEAFLCVVGRKSCASSGIGGDCIMLKYVREHWASFEEDKLALCVLDTCIWPVEGPRMRWLCTQPSSYSSGCYIEYLGHKARLSVKYLAVQR